ncbi:MAG: hypothetical protein J07HB67_00202, partial [halophilic archaeon J07HB67]
MRASTSSSTFSSCCLLTIWRADSALAANVWRNSDSVCVKSFLISEPAANTPYPSTGTMISDRIGLSRLCAPSVSSTSLTIRGDPSSNTCQAMLSSGPNAGSWSNNPLDSSVCATGRNNCSP